MKSSLSRILVGLLAAAGLVGASVNAQAATATGNFNVNVTLTSKCEINGTAAATGAVITDIALAYTSFQTSAATGSTSFNVCCTNSLPYTLALDLTTVTDQALNLDYPLDAIQGFTARFNAAEQSLAIDFSANAFAATRIGQAMGQRPVVSPSEFATFLNYDLNYNASQFKGSGRYQDAGALMELGMTGPLGVLTSSHIGNNLLADTVEAPARWRRLETTFTRDFPDHSCSPPTRCATALPWWRCRVMPTSGWAGMCWVCPTAPRCPPRG